MPKTDADFAIRQEKADKIAADAMKVFALEPQYLAYVGTTLITDALNALIERKELDTALATYFTTNDRMEKIAAQLLTISLSEMLSGNGVGEPNGKHGG